MRDPQLIVALDVASAEEALALVDRLPVEVRWVKVGLELFGAAGPGLLAPLRARGKRIFLDLKLHDIPHTVERAVSALARHGPDLLTVHAGGGGAMLAAAAAAATGHLQLLAVTTLTSLGTEDLLAVGCSRAPAEQARLLAELAWENGVTGLVSSPWEAEGLRQRFGPTLVLVTPGIRPAGAASGDQKRVATPAVARRAGADFLVVGRPITRAPDPRAAAAALLQEIGSTP